MKHLIFLGFGVDRNGKGKITGFMKTFQYHLFQTDI